MPTLVQTRPVKLGHVTRGKVQLRVITAANPVLLSKEKKPLDAIIAGGYTAMSIGATDEIVQITVADGIQEFSWDGDVWAACNSDQSTIHVVIHDRIFG